MKVQPYLFFDGRCEEALEFYKSALGAEVVALHRFKDSPEPHSPGCVPPGAENKVMHACFRIGETQVMASDGRCEGKPSFQGFSLSIAVPNEAEAERLFAALADRGQEVTHVSSVHNNPGVNLRRRDIGGRDDRARREKASRRRRREDPPTTRIEGETIMTTSNPEHPTIVSRDEWTAARILLLKNEKELTKLR